jgi:hypothetical protein
VRRQSPQSKPLIRGAITASEQGGRRLTLLGYVVQTDSATTLYRGEARKAASFRELTPGVLVEAKVVRRGKRLVATRVRIEEREPVDRAACIDAPVERIDLASGRVVVLGASLPIPTETVIADEPRVTGSPQSSAARLRRDDDEQQVRPLRVGDAITIGGRIESSFVDRSDFDLRRSRPDRNERVDSQLQVLAIAALSPSFEANAKVSTDQRVSVLDQRGPAPMQSEFRVEEMYLTIHDPGGLRMTAQVGRQRFRDAREWLFDDYLDAIRIKTDLARWTFDVAVAQALFPPGEADREARDAQHLLASATTRVGPAALNAFVIHRRGDLSGATPTWIGGTLSGHLTTQARYWSLVTIRRGQAGSVRLGGWAADLGTTWQAPLRAHPSVTLAYAAASGDDRPNDGVDTAFHQTGLNDNKARFGGLKRFAYYGEALRPELSDISIFTVGGAAMPWRKGSIDVIYHRYVRRSDGRWTGAKAVHAAATGGARHLGDEIDAVVVSQAIRGLDLSLIVGLFRPGAAFPQGRSSAIVWRPQIRFYF